MNGVRVAAVGLALWAMSSCTDSGGDSALKATPSQGRLELTLNGAAEAPAPGDPDGKGMAAVRFDETGPQKQVCIELTVEALDQVVAVHLQQGKLGQPGPIVMPFPEVVDGKATGCRPIDDQRFGSIKAQPQDYFVNVRTSTYPGGAIRGQLAGGDTSATTVPPRPPGAPPLGPGSPTPPPG